MADFQRFIWNAGDRSVVAAIPLRANIDRPSIFGGLN
jgi:hypothetical protein